jgi:hypothetical protein
MSDRQAPEAAFEPAYSSSFPTLDPILTAE